MLPIIGEDNSSTAESFPGLRQPGAKSSGTNDRLGESDSHKLSVQRIVLHFWGNGLCITGARHSPTECISGQCLNKHCPGGLRDFKVAVSSTCWKLPQSFCHQSPAGSILQRYAVLQTQRGLCNLLQLLLRQPQQLSESWKFWHQPMLRLRKSHLLQQQMH